MYNNLVHISINLISIVCKKLPAYERHSLPAPLCCYCHTIHIVCASTQIYTYCLMYQSFKSRKIKNYKQKIVILLLIFTFAITCTSVLYFMRIPVTI